MDPSAVKVLPMKDHPLLDRLPDKPTVAPAFSIPIDPLGFAAPSDLYFGERFSMASLDFLDEDHLLFTFRVPGLIVRTPGVKEDDDEHHIRAVVLSLPSGAVQAEALWTLYDRERYLWMLKDGHFLLRNQNTVSQGDATLQLKPLFRFPGTLLWMEMDPTEQYLVTNSREPVETTTQPGQVPSPSTASADIEEEGQDSGEKPDLVVRVLRRDTGQVMLVSRVRAPVHLPINDEGYLDSLRGIDSQWELMMNDFTGKTAELGRVESACWPTLDFISEREFLVTGCGRDGSYQLLAMTTNGLRLWQDSTSGYTVWPLLLMSANGLRIVRETFAVTREIGVYWALDRSYVKAQRVRVFDAATGNVALEALANPVLDAGGNVAISASGRRVAILTGGAIQVFNLPLPPSLPKGADSAR